MKLTINTCYSKILWIMCSGPVFSDCVSSLKITKGPCHNHEGLAGYIETEVELEIKDLKGFSDLWDSWYSLSETRRLQVYGLAKGLGDCR